MKVLDRLVTRVAREVRLLEQALKATNAKTMLEAYFVGTRVPVKSLYDYLEAGDSLDEFLESFPSVTREQVVAALELARSMTEAHATAAR